MLFIISQDILNTNLLLIDATSINNKYGNESIVVNPGLWNLDFGLDIKRKK